MSFDDSGCAFSLWEGVGCDLCGVFLGLEFWYIMSLLVFTSFIVDIETLDCTKACSGHVATPSISLLALATQIMVRYLTT